MNIDILQSVINLTQDLIAVILYSLIRNSYTGHIKLFREQPAQEAVKKTRLGKKKQDREGDWMNGSLIRSHLTLTLPMIASFRWP